MLNLLILVVLLQNPPTEGASLATAQGFLPSVVSGTLPPWAEFYDITKVPLTGFGAQTAAAPIAIQPGETFQVQWTVTSDPLRPLKFRAWLDGAIIKNFADSDLTVTGAPPRTFTTNAGVVPPFTAAQAGIHVLAITAFDSGGESSPAAATTAAKVAYTTPPPAPADVKILILKIAVGPIGAATLQTITEAPPAAIVK